MASTPPVIAVIDPSGGEPEVEIVVFHLHKAKYQFLLFDSTGANPAGVGKPDGMGTTGDPDPDRFPLGLPAAQLHRRILWWQAALSDLVGGGASQPFSVVVRLLQNGKIVALGGGAGAMNDPHVDGRFHLKVKS